MVLFIVWVLIRSLTVAGSGHTTHELDPYRRAERCLMAKRKGRSGKWFRAHDRWVQGSSCPAVLIDPGMSSLITSCCLLVFSLAERPDAVH